jgi:hypothetical protein
MVHEWGNRNVEEFYLQYGKNKDGKKRHTSSDIVRHLKANVIRIELLNNSDF